MSRRRGSQGFADVNAWFGIALLSGLHGWALWVGLGGTKGLLSGWPIWRHDHPLYYHSALVTRSFLRQTATTAGYDPSFMAGYAKSVVFPASSTLPELVVACFGGDRPELAYKLYVLIAGASLPWLMACAGRLWGARSGATAVAVLLFLIYVWTDFPISYIEFGMLPYALSVPMGLVATGAFCGYLERGGILRWLATGSSMVLVVLIHLTSALIVAPAAALVYGVRLSRLHREPPLPASRHAGVWLLPVLVLAANAFWWAPGLWLAATKGPSDFAFAHPEGVLVRLWQIVSIEPAIQAVLLALGTIGLLALSRRGGVLPTGLVGFAAAGFFWGYVAGGVRSLDFLQPGRHTFAFYSALALASGVGVSEILERVRSDGRLRLDRWAAAGLILVGLRLFGPAVETAVRSRITGSRPFLDSRPTPRLKWIVDRVKRYVKPGERLLYEESGFGLPGVPDPFDDGRFSGLLPDRTGVEVIGGPYLHASLVTNFTQFGEGKLFGQPGRDRILGDELERLGKRPRTRRWGPTGGEGPPPEEVERLRQSVDLGLIGKPWGRDHFARYARLYRPSAILCWSPWARKFCRANSDVVEILEDDGTLLIGRVLGFSGAAIEGEATVEAKPGRLIVRGAKGGVDGTVVLRYHSVPCLRSRPAVSWDGVILEDDPTPFIRLRPPAGSGPITFEIQFPTVLNRLRGR
jgi:hypothetical protein